jgi:hypothetical protein
MPVNRSEVKSQHTAQTGHTQFSDTVYGVICADCKDYILFDNTNCPPTCRDHEPCRQAYGG